MFGNKNFDENDYNIVFAGNPNVGKSTVFNELTGMNQHTGNWAGKTVDLASGSCVFNDKTYRLIDVPGTYSLLSHSQEEEVARNHICFSNPDCVIVVCDAACLERNLNLVLQIIEITSKVVVCVNLYDEAKKKKIYVDCENLAQQLGVRVVPTEARSGKGMKELMTAVEETVLYGNAEVIKTRYIAPIEEACDEVSEKIGSGYKSLNKRWLALRLIEENDDFVKSLEANYAPLSDELKASISEARIKLSKYDISSDNYIDRIVSCLVLMAEGIALECIKEESARKIETERRIDRFVTNKSTGIPIMILFLALILWITIVGANYPSQLLSDFFEFLGTKLHEWFFSMNAPEVVSGLLLDGVYKVLTWVIAVMLPPMAIFFPLFTLLEDFGFLPRIAFNLDKFFSKANACGKQALTMAMGFGCNACGVSGCRIIDSPRERIIAMVTNVFVPCNGRFPTLIAIITMFLIGGISGMFQSVISAGILTAVIVLGVAVTLLISWILSHTILKGEQSSFTLELPPYRKPQIGKVIVRSLLDRTLFVLGRAVVVAAPAGLIIWILANTNINDISLLQYCTDFLDPFGRLFGMDGVIIMAFILGFPANEIVIPIIIMCYLSGGVIIDMENLSELQILLTANGWTIVTAISTMLFSLMHFPCSTTCLTIYKETKSIKWTVLSFVIPTLTGLAICFIFANIARIFI